ncbi:Bug family tripartite tricarboxylate transporter substrate binding protein [Ramlibacter sp. MAHUQ-53]|uniref:Bug family tripartite tricarboxylate transporter substrate binding protein n=1 Tax=unclassified Ramlibacter TaxID=2617605 RepID=UPI003645CD89
MNRRSTFRLLPVLLAALTGTAAMAQAFPPKPTITLTVGFAAGGAADTAARIIAKKLGENIGATVVVDNKPGAGGNIAHSLVANGPADGSTILLGSIGPLALAPHMMKVTYDPLKDLAPIAMAINTPNLLVVPANSPYKTFAEFIAFARKNPGKIDFASTGPGSASHLAGELVNDIADVDMLHVPYKGGAPAMQDLLGGRVAAHYSTVSTAKPHIDAGKLIPLASTGPQRLASYPKVPTVAESGFPGFSATNWYAFVASSKVPKATLDRWNTEIVKVLKSPDVIEQLNTHGLTPQPSTREELDKTIRTEYATYGRVIKQRNIKGE